MEIESSRSRGHGEPDAAAAWVTVEEWGGSSGFALSRTAVITASPSSCSVPFASFVFDPLSSHARAHRPRFGSRVLGAFVPEGFPGSVTPDYVPFQMWDTLQHDDLPDYLLPKIEMVFKEFEYARESQYVVMPLHAIQHFNGTPPRWVFR